MAVGVGGNVTAVGVGGRVIAVGVGAGVAGARLVVGSTTGVLTGSEAVHATTRKSAAETTAIVEIPGIELIWRMIYGKRFRNADELYVIGCNSLFVLRLGFINHVVGGHILHRLFKK